MPVSSFSKLFGRSPIRPLQEHMTKVKACIQELLPFFDALISEDWHQAESFQQEISQLEKDADRLKKELRSHLPKGLFLPVHRTDLLELLTIQDQIANRAKDIAGLTLGRRMSLPENIRDEFIQFLRRSIDATNQAHQAIGELDELLETGFRGNELDIVEEMISELDSIESDTDSMQISIRAKVFEVEKHLPPVDVIFLYKIIEWVGDLADRAQRVGSRLQVLLAR